MLSFDKILCPLDFSEHSLKALHAAKEMAARFQSTLILLHVNSPVFQGGNIGYNAPSMDFNVTLYQKELNRSAQKSLNDVISKHLDDANFEVQPRVATGREAEQITRLAEKEAVDLIVIATHGKSGLKRLLLGSVAERVIRHARQPVLIIRISNNHRTRKKAL